LRLRDRNRRGPDVLGSPFPPLRPLDVDDVHRQRDAGAVVVDARPVRAWADGHIPGSVAIALRPQFASWLGWLVPDDRPLVFVLDHGQDAGDLVRQARTIGYDHLVGALDGGIDQWRAAGLPVAATELLDAPDLDRAVVDVRQRNEYEAGHLPGAVPIELGALADHADAVPPGAVAVMCGHGERAATAASLLEHAGRHDVAVVVGGPDDWATPGRRLQTE